MTTEQLKARVAELEIATQDMQRVLDNVRQYSEELEKDFEDRQTEVDGDMIAADLYEILKGYGNPGAKA